MTTQTEAELENQLIAKLQTLGWERITINDEDALIANLKRQLEKHNEASFSDKEFKQILNQINKGNIFEKAKILRQKLSYIKDDGKTGYMELINQEYWCKNEYQVTNQITMRGTYQNRYDVTLLVNGLPLAQIELKRRGLEMKEAFNQINRYHAHSFSAGMGLFNYIQIFIISNGVNTKYFANAPHNLRDYKQTFYWTNEENERISDMNKFAEIFLEKCQLSKMLTRYIVLNESNKQLMALRPYQYYAVENIEKRVKESNKNGYIWHTTGSGKTLTSFKTAQILTQNPDVHKVLFVVDRKDLDYQTMKEFNSFKKDSVDATTNTSKLVAQCRDDTKLIVTTLQKLNTAITKERHLTVMEELRHKKIIFIFDECHRSQFGDTHKRIKEHFEHAQMFGFTGTPIFKDNAYKGKGRKYTTKDLFDEALHKYVINNAIKDENVLKFSVEYYNVFKQKEYGDDEQVEAIDHQEIFEADDYINQVSDHIIKNHNRKTHNKQFNAIFCTSNIKTLMKYYDAFKQKQAETEHNLKIATIFSYTANEDTDDDNDDSVTPQHSREKLEECIKDYNAIYSTNYSTDSFDSYYKDISKRVKNRDIDILLVVNMFLTGFDSQRLNTIYVDKNLKYHGLLQAFSRTNRIYRDKKSQGNVLCYRNLKANTDKAIELFANKNAVEDIIVLPYETYLNDFQKAYDRLMQIAPTCDDVDKLTTEEDELKFITAFRDLVRILNTMKTFGQFNEADLPISEQEIADYQSKYLDLYEKVKNNTEKEKISILDDIDFQLELISRDIINVRYIIELLASMKDKSASEQEKTRKTITSILDSEAQLRSKKELIEQFINKYVNLKGDINLHDEWENYKEQEAQKAISALCQNEKLDQEKLQQLISDYQFTQIKPTGDKIIAIIEDRHKPSLKERKNKKESIITKINNFIETFYNDKD